MHTYSPRLDNIDQTADLPGHSQLGNALHETEAVHDLDARMLQIDQLGVFCIAISRLRGIKSRPQL